MTWRLSDAGTEACATDATGGAGLRAGRDAGAKSSEPRYDKGVPDADLIAAVRTAVPEGLRLDRTECDCDADVAFCRQIPGQLIGADLDALEREIGPDALEDCLQASRGAKIVLDDREWRVPTIRPRMRDGRCVFLGDDARCRVHAIAPFGCAYFDAHMSREISDARAWWGIAAIVADPRYLTWHARLKALRGEVDPLAR
ncbi:MAG: hypothetical protein FJZ01_22405 [Candidatus Sericytochromatia bacterium]|nr:hypothetical protein [Candidatus Tanganyikabacteria bacterium]